MNQIKDPPNDNYDFGLDFNYAVWTPGTTITMCNVPWNNDYRDVVKFISRNALNLYIDSLSASSINLTGLSYAKQGQPIRINVPFNTAYKYNYLRASNPYQPIPGGDVSKQYYYFITDVRYLAPNTTEIVIQLDVWQTFGFDIEFGNSYVERGHIGIANTNAFDHYGRDYLTIAEGLDVGTDLQMIGEEGKLIMSTVDLPSESFPTSANILVASTVDLTADPGTVDNPKLVTAKGGVFLGIPSGATFYLFKNGYSFAAWLTSMQTKPWVTQGIISATCIPNMKRSYPSFTWPADGTPLVAQEDGAISNFYYMYPNWRNQFIENLPDRYKHLKKFLTFPYSMIEMTTLTGNPIVIKPELWQDANAPIQEYIALIPPGQKMSFVPVKYNYGVDTADFDASTGEGLDHATHIGKFPELAVVNNGAIQYLAANRNSIAYQKDSADWTQQRALGSNQAQYDVQTQGMETARALTNIGISADVNQTANINRTQAVQSGIGAAQSVLGSGAHGAIAGPQGALVGLGLGGINAAAGMAQMGVQLGANNEALAIRNTAATQSIGTQNAMTGFARDTNKNLADWAARGDYGNSIAGVNAKVHDAAMIQPSVSGQMGGEILNYVMGMQKIILRFKMLDLANIRTVGEYWLRYGYMVHKYMKPPISLMAMTKFTYWKLSETYIKAGPMPETYKQTIRGIFEKGVTVWATPDDIGNIDIADNEIIPGISY